MMEESGLNERINSLLLSTKREGMEQIVKWLDSGYNFFVSAGSRKSHDNWRGGLAGHSLRTYEEAVKLWNGKDNAFKKQYPMESVIIAALLHDVCKIDVYVIGKDGYPLRQEKIRKQGHGLRSVRLLKEHGLKLTYDEELAIWWHMDEFELKEVDYKPVNKYQKEYDYAMSNPFCRLISLADDNATTLSNRQQRERRKNSTEWNANDVMFRLEASKSPRVASEIQTEVYKHNLLLFKTWSYTASDGRIISLGNKVEVLDATKVYSKCFSVNDLPSGNECPQTGAVNEDCLVIAKRLIDGGYNPAVLNLADAYHACGMYNVGSSAQEESLCRASTLSQTLYQYFNKQWAQKADVPLRTTSAYPMDIQFGGIYSPRVTVFRGNKTTGYALMDNPFETAFISVAALNFRDSDNKTDNLQYKAADGGFTEEGKVVMMNKIRTIYRIALANGHDSVVLGAFGCGVFQLKPELVAELFQQVLQEEEFKNKFKAVVFAILEGKASSRKRVGEEGPNAAFYNLFGKWE